EERLGTVAVGIVELGADMASQRGGLPDAGEVVGAAQLGWRLAAGAFAAGELSGVEDEHKVGMVDRFEEVDHLVAGADEGAVVVVLQADRDSRIRPLDTELPHRGGGTVEGPAAFSLGRRRAGED